jgi:hypothetical protein
VSVLGLLINMVVLMLLVMLVPVGGRYRPTGNTFDVDLADFSASTFKAHI